ncbi:MAG: hypothetical protein RL017_742 [Pseudomonadota bacterium]
MPLKRFIIFLLGITVNSLVFAQMRSGSFNSMSGMGGRMSGTATAGDSLQKRDKNADSITIFYKLYNNNEIKQNDSSINDFYKRFPLPYTYYNLGNTGTASNSYLFSPVWKAGFDAGFHQYEIYNYTLAATPFYQTTRPYTELVYLLGGKGEQLVELKHTQNKKQQLNFSFDYRFSNSPGNVKNQQANFSNMRITAHFQSKRKRYESFWVMLNNKTASSENGGLVNAARLDSLALNNPYELETRLGVSSAAFRNPFNTNISTGSIYQDNTLVWKQTYDLGQKDSVVKDTVTTYLFYPRLRFQNEIKYQQQSFLFQDASPHSYNYTTYFNYPNSIVDNTKFKDQWNILSNEFSLISYPQKNNSNQFLQVGAGLSNQTGSFLTRKDWSAQDSYGFGAYKNKTKNQVWDIDLYGQLYLVGYHAGDYITKASLTSLLNKKGNYVQLAFNNVNRTPSTNAMGITDFPIIGLNNIKKENHLQLMGATGNIKKAWKASFTYQLINNYQYYSTGYTAAVYQGTIHYINAQLANQFKLSTHWNWYNEVHLQLVDAASPLRVPTILTRQRIAFEGVFYKNLNMSTGLEFIYHTNYKANFYMPFTGQFYQQNEYTLSNRPMVNAFYHMTIKRLKAYIRVENLNTLLPTNNTLGNHYNFTAKNYPGTGIWVRVGIWWHFIN